MLMSARPGLIVLGLFAAFASAHRKQQRFLIVSAPRDSKISYKAIRPGHEDDPKEPLMTLIDTGLTHPQGLAVDQKRRKLLVADPDAKKIWSYALLSSGDKLSVGERTIAAVGAEARWVAVDATGNLFFSDELRNQILKVPAGRALRGDPMPESVYDGSAVSFVSAPGGLAVDSFDTYWVNKRIGRRAGSVVRGSQKPASNASMSLTQVLTTNSDKSYGVCLALNNVYYTQPESSIYAVKKKGGSSSLISDKLTNPRGCAWDGEGTVYVADRGANAVYSFAGNMEELGPTRLSLIATYQDAFGVAVYADSGASRRLPWILGLVLAVVLAHV